MEDTGMRDFIREVLENMPSDWLRLTTHRLDIYHEERAKTEFLEEFEGLFKEGNTSASALAALHTAYDYIRLGHPLSCVLEWVIAREYGVEAENVISFASKTIPAMAVLRTNQLAGKHTRIVHSGELPECFDAEALRSVYGYQFELMAADGVDQLSAFEGTTVFITTGEDQASAKLADAMDVHIQLMGSLGSVLTINGDRNRHLVSEVQHVRRRETIAMTPANTLVAIRERIGQSGEAPASDRATNKAAVLNCICEITGTDVPGVVASSGLSMQYAIMMGLVQEALEQHPGKAIRFLVPPNCYGGTNDQARRVAASIDGVEVLDLPVDAGNDMVQSIDRRLSELASEDAIPYIIVEIPTNPRVEVPDLGQLREVLSKPRQTAAGSAAIDPVFILDQTFCPNVHFLGEAELLAEVRTIAYVSGSKFPSGGLCTAGYAVANQKAAALMSNIDRHLRLCDNEATDLQLEILAKQLPSMNQRIEDAYQNTRAFVNFIQEKLPEAKINFVSEELASQTFTPSVFSLDLPTKGETEEERETYKRALNLKLINRMIEEIPGESKYCVSYGQLKGCYWTIPATSTQGTTKEGDKDYIARVALSPDMDLERHQQVFAEFVAEM